MFVLHYVFVIRSTRLRKAARAARRKAGEQKLEHCGSRDTATSVKVRAAWRKAGAHAGRVSGIRRQKYAGTRFLLGCNPSMKGDLARRSPTTRTRGK